MAINLLDIKPHKISRDLSGYITYIYGAPKTGKTTLAVQAPNSLLLAFERGYNALPGVIAQDITSWSEMRQIWRELKKPEVREVYKTLIIDTVDIASDCCQKYICNQEGISALGDLGFGKGWAKFKSEFDEVFRGLTQLGYAVIFISHAKEVANDNDDNTNAAKKKSEITTLIKPSLQSSSNAIIENMADIYGYARNVRFEDGTSKVMLALRSPDGTIKCGCRFKYIKPEIEFNYDALVKAINEAIEEEARHNSALVTNEKSTTVEKKEYDFPAMMEDFQKTVGDLMSANQSNAVKISSIVEKYLGKGKRASDCTPDQCEQLELILIDLKDLLV